MNLDELERLAKATKCTGPDGWDRFYLAANPQVVAALIECVRAADAMRDEFYFIKDSKLKTGQKYDAARAALKEKP